MPDPRPGEGSPYLGFSRGWCSPGPCRFQVWRSRGAGREGKTAPDLPEVLSSMQRELCPHQRWPSLLTSAAFNSHLLEGRGGSVDGRAGGGRGRGWEGRSREEPRGTERLTQLPAHFTAKLCILVFYKHPNGTILMIPL